jgi:CheY-like chemotaxis protein
MPTILVVEDDRAIREALVDALSADGYAVISAPDGVQALALLRDEPLPDLIVLDLMLPNMSGQQFRVRQVGDGRLRDIPVVVLSAVPLASEIAHALRAQAVLAKPVQLEELLMTVERMLQ